MPKKYRGHGEGSIYQRKDGRWEAILDLGYDAQGRRRRLRFYGKTRKEVQEKLTAALEQRRQGTLVLAPAKLTVGEFMERWLEEYASVAVRPSTYEGYQYLVRKHILPTIGKLPLSKLQPLHLQGLYAEKLKAGLSPRRVECIHAVLHNALEHAVKWGLVPRNAASAADPPRPKKYEQRVLSPDEVTRFLRAAEGDRLYALFVLAVTAGLRRGELLGLRWSDVDLERGTIQVRQTIQRVRGQGLVPSETKSQRSRRLVVLPAFAVAALKRHKAQQAQEKLLFGPAYQDNDLVFCKEWGAPLDGSWLSRYIHRILEKAGLPKIRLHDLRHTSATLLLAQGVHPKIVSERLGHSTIHLTLDTYSHVLPDMQKEAAQKLDELLNRPRKEQGITEP